MGLITKGMGAIIKGAKGAPTAANFRRAAQTARKR